MADWIKEMENDSEGDFVAFGDEDERILTIVSEPTKGVSRFQNPDGSEKVEYSFQVLVDDNTERVKSWNVSARQVMQQIVAIMKNNNLTKITGEKLRVTTSGSGRDRRYIVRRIPPKQGQTKVEG